MKMKRLKDDATWGDETYIYPEGRIINSQRNRTKIQIGNNTHIRGELFLFAHGGEIQIGDFCFIGEHSHIWSSAKVTIGNGVLIAHNVNIHDSISHPIETDKRYQHTIDILTKGHPSAGLDLKEKPVVINDYAWIGFNATILRGVTIGKGAVIGACTLITQDVPDYAIMVGNPARIVGYSTPKS